MVDNENNSYSSESRFDIDESERPPGMGAPGSDDAAATIAGNGEESNFGNDHAPKTTVTPSPQPSYGVAPSAQYYYYAPKDGETKNKKGLLAKTLGAIPLAALAFAFGLMGNWAGAKLGIGASHQPIVPPVIYETRAPSTESLLPAVSRDLRDVVAMTADSVVEIASERTRTSRYFGQYVTEGGGSGVIITSDGNILTNSHVVQNASKLTVTLRNGSKFDAKVVGDDPKNDLAVIKIDASGLTTAVFGDSDELMVGDQAIVIGNPLGELGGTVTQGIISALERRINVEGQLMTLLQTDAAVNSGNSGGGLFNSRGELVGIINAKYQDRGVEGLGFAIPINIARPAYLEMISSEWIPQEQATDRTQIRAQIGVRLLDILDSRTADSYGVETFGVYILGFVENSYAQRDGAMVGDRIVSVNGAKVNEYADILPVLSKLSVGDIATIVVDRDGADITLQIELTESKSP
ncbi:MAG: trypsin-like peptidase domain-containing protein [Eubacteriaceae bacterium]|nr:trypsin-like peptidase domain-containing protein [Eubacteriaceae bacterium]